MSLFWNSVPKDERLQRLQLPDVGAPLSAQAAQALAVDVALQGLGFVSPNPLVGAVIVDHEHRFLASGAHQQIGCDHAEIVAINSLKKMGKTEALQGATLYVTLEPCAHENKTPACAPYVAKSGIKKVVVGATDPNPKVDGKGIEILRQVGVASEQDRSWQPACEELGEIFLWNMRRKKIFVGLKVAASLNGVTARRGDQRAWITGERARQYGHFLRIYYDAVAVGAETLILDDPSLDARQARVEESHRRSPYKVIFDPQGRALLAARKKGLKSCGVLKQEPQKVLWLMQKNVSEDKNELNSYCRDLESMGARLVYLPVKKAKPARFDLDLALATLQRFGIYSLLLEGGAGLYQSFLNQNLVNKVYAFQAPQIMSGHDLLGWGQDQDASVMNLERVTITPLRNDWLLEAGVTFKG